MRYDTLNIAHRASPERGASMLEVLVALFIISFGLLGIGGISIATLGYNKAAQLRLTGLNLINDYADRARLNVYGFDLGDYAIAIDDELPTRTEANATLDELNPDEDNPATAARAVAGADKAQFQRTVADRLPQGRVIAATSGPGSDRTLNIWLLWQEPQTALDDNLFVSGQFNCPDSLTAEQQAIYSCMYFNIGL
jgi:type IV pilus assembly protein PilV